MDSAAADFANARPSAGGCVAISEAMLTTNYETYCDPRLNYGQSIEAAFAVADAAKA